MHLAFALLELGHLGSHHRQLLVDQRMSESIRSLLEHCRRLPVDCASTPSTFEVRHSETLTFPCHGWVAVCATWHADSYSLDHSSLQKLSSAPPPLQRTSEEVKSVTTAGGQSLVDDPWAGKVYSDLHCVSRCVMSQICGTRHDVLNLWYIFANGIYHLQVVLTT